MHCWPGNPGRVSGWEDPVRASGFSERARGVIENETLARGGEQLPSVPSSSSTKRHGRC